MRLFKDSPPISRSVNAKGLQNVGLPLLSPPMRSLFPLLLGLLLCFGLPVHAQEPAPTPVTLTAAPEVSASAPAETPVNNFENIKEKMGKLFYPLLILSFITVALMLFIAFTVRQNTIVSDAFMNSADALIRKQDYLGLLSVCNRRNECVAKVTAKALDFATKNPTASFDEVREVTEAEGSRQSSLILQRVSYLGDIGAIAPMMGLLGTVFGLITSFAEISQTQFAGSQAAGVANGVFEALYCTAVGLIIGIPALVVYSMYRGKAQRLISELEAASTHLMALLSAQYKRAARAAVTRGPAHIPHEQAM